MASVGIGFHISSCQQHPGKEGWGLHGSRKFTFSEFSGAQSWLIGKTGIDYGFRKGFSRKQSDASQDLIFDYFVWGWETDWRQCTHSLFLQIKVGFLRGLFCFLLSLWRFSLTFSPTHSGDFHWVSKHWLLFSLTDLNNNKSKTQKNIQDEKGEKNVVTVQYHTLFQQSYWVR